MQEEIACFGKEERAAGRSAGLQESTELEQHQEAHTAHLQTEKLLKADKIFSAVHRLNLFPLLHLGFLHMLFDVLALTPLLERFEAEFGTIVTLSLFTGRKKLHMRKQ